MGTQELSLINRPATLRAHYQTINLVVAPKKYNCSVQSLLVAYPSSGLLWLLALLRASVSYILVSLKDWRITQSGVRNVIFAPGAVL
jgi:hypothetical protein